MRQISPRESVVWRDEHGCIKPEMAASNEESWYDAEIKKENLMKYDFVTQLRQLTVNICDKSVLMLIIVYICFTKNQSLS